jgi:GntR family transcriptional regulator
VVATATKQSEAREKVLDLIETLGIGDAIPSERQLSSDLGVSRLTVRAALDDLVRDGYLVRRRGSGTFVSEPKIAQELTMTSFTEDMRRRGMEPASRTLELRTTSAGPWLGRSCTSRPRSRSSSSSASGSPTTRRWRSRRCTSGRRSCPGSPADDLETQSFYTLLSERYGIDIVGGSQTIEPTVTNEEESEALGVPLHSPAFLSSGRPARARRDRRVRPLAVPRRPLPARHRAQPPARRR